MFSDKQVFTGKGAGSYPTASAVLSDISALQYDYRYEYKKLAASKLDLADDFEIKAFVSAKSAVDLAKISFKTVEEEFTSADYAYKIGRVKVSQLTHVFYRQNPELFIGFFGEGDIAVKNEGLKQLTEEVYN